jgi:N-acetylglucosamine-6-sulfatase
MPARVRTGAWTRSLAVLGLAAALGGALIGDAARSGAQEAVSSAKRPNFVVITTDDQDAASLRRAVMPHVLREIGARGTVFESGLASPPLCCPSRAGFLTGQYPHNHGVFRNNPGYPTLRRKVETLPKWLKASGYRTGFAGKFLNGYARSSLKGVKSAPGFDRWYAVHERRLYYHHEMTINGRVRRFGGGKRDYLTKVITRYSKRFVKRGSRRGKPFFLWTSYWAPHYSQRERVKGPCDNLVTPGPGDERAFRGARLPRPPSFNERDIGDKPPFLRDLRLLTKSRKHRLARSYRCRLASLLAVDRGVNSIVKALKRSGELNDTVLVFTSDNGFYHGEHRITHGKSKPYEPAIRVPLAIRVPAAHLGGPRTTLASEPASNVDLTPTILELAGAKPCRKGKCRTLDGRSLVPLLTQGDAGWPQDRGVLLEAKKGRRGCYAAIRTERFFYAEHGRRSPRCTRTRQRELYDLQADPHELTNLLSPRSGASPASIQVELERRLDALRKCAGVAGRDRGTAARCE